MQVSSGGAKIFFNTLGSGPDLMLVHAFPSCHEMWLPAAESLASHYRVTVLDLRGHGQSSTPEGPALMQHHAADLERVCREAKIEKAVFAGVSIGGYVLFEFWRGYSARVRALILCDTRATADNDEGRANRLKSADDVQQRGVQPFLDSMIPKLLGETTRRNRLDIVAAARQTMRYCTPAGIAAAQLGMAERPDSVGIVKSISVPTLVLCGDEDVLTPMGDAQTLAREIANAKLEIIPQAGHYAVFEKPHETLSVMRKFLDVL